MPDPVLMPPPAPSAAPTWPRTAVQPAEYAWAAWCVLLPSLALPAGALALSTPPGAGPEAIFLRALVGGSLSLACLLLLPITLGRARDARPPTLPRGAVLGVAAGTTGLAVAVVVREAAFYLCVGPIAFVLAASLLAGVLGVLGAAVDALADRAATIGARDGAQPARLAAVGLAATTGAAYWWTPWASGAVPVLATVLGLALLGILRRDARRATWLARVYAGAEPAWCVRPATADDAVRALPQLLGADDTRAAVLCARAPDGATAFRGGAQLTPIAWAPATAAAARWCFARRARGAAFGGGVVVALHGVAWLLAHGT